jgi:hypothetical protein
MSELYDTVYLVDSQNNSITTLPQLVNGEFFYLSQTWGDKRITLKIGCNGWDLDNPIYTFN